MANKYSRYELVPFPSLYVDDKKPEIAQLLAQRYDNNKTSKDLIDRTLSQLDLMDGDKGHLERVKTNVKGMLKDHVSQGDWENSSLVVQDAAQLVQTDAGLIASNKSMQNRQKEINAIREARLNGIPMLDFGAHVRNTHQSYVFDEETGTYQTNIYEHASEKQLDYRSRKEAMVGKIPADQRGNLLYVGRGKTNKIAKLLVEQYISDTHEGMQEYKKLIQIDLPQTLPLEERQKLAKNAILQDFKETAQQQEFKKVTAGSGDGKRSSGAGGLPEGLTITSSMDSGINSEFNQMDDKVKELQMRNLVYLKQLNSGLKDDGTALTDEDKTIIRTNIKNNNATFDRELRKVGNKTKEGKNALIKYDRIKKKFDKFGDDGELLFSATQYLTYLNADNNTDWGEVASGMLIGGSTFATGAAIGGQAGPQIALPEEVITVPGAFVVGGGVGGVSSMIAQMTDDLRNVRDWHRPQEGGYITGSLGLTDNEREQLAEELWGDEDLGDATVEHANKILGTNFSESDKEELMSMTNAWYTFMTKDKLKSGSGKVDRTSGDDLLEQVTENKWTISQRAIGFDMTGEGKTLRNNTNAFIEGMDLNNAGITFDNMLPSSNELGAWIEDAGGMDNVKLSNVLVADIPTNTPLRLVFSHQDDESGTISSRTAYVSDPTVVQPGGWVWDLLEKNMQIPHEGLNEMMRQDFDSRGYDNVSVGEYLLNQSKSEAYYFGGGTEEEASLIREKKEDDIITSLLLNPNVPMPQYTNSLGQRGVTTNEGGFIPFITNTGTFNQAAWLALQAQPAKLANLRKTISEYSLNEFQQLKF